MQKTENLKLNIIDGTDVPSHAIFNENFNKIDLFSKEQNDKMVNLENSNEQFINDVTEQFNNFKNEVNNTVKEIEQTISEVNIEINGVSKKGKLKRLVVKTTPAYNSFYSTIPYIDTQNNVLYDISEKRCLVTNYSGYGSINMTELIGITDVNDILLLGTKIYSDEYVLVTTGKSNTIPMDCYSLGKFTYPGAGNDIYISFSGNRTSFVLQEFKGITSGGWIPSPTPSSPISEVYIVINYILFDKE